MLKPWFCAWIDQWHSYRGFRRFNEPGPPSSWGPPSQATKIEQGNNRRTTENTNNQSLYQRQLSTSERTVSTSMTFLVCRSNSGDVNVSVCIFLQTLLSIHILLIYSFLEIYGRPAIIDSRIFSKHVQRPAEVYMCHSLKWTLLIVSPQWDISPILYIQLYSPTITRFLKF